MNLFIDSFVSFMNSSLIHSPKAGRLLAERLFNNGTRLTDYVNVATTVFTPLEYGAIGYSEEDSIKFFGESNIEVFHTMFWPLEWTVAHRPENSCYAKVRAFLFRTAHCNTLHRCL